MGEAPLNSLTETHAFRASALSTLSRLSHSVQSKGWWFNMETLIVTPNLDDGRVYLPTDVGTVLPSHANINVVQRGRVLYNLDEGTDRFDPSFRASVRLTRVIDIEDVPSSVAELIASKVVLEFQNLYDGDQTKTRNLTELVNQLSIAAVQEHVRNRRVNLIDTNERLSRVRNTINYSRRPR